MSQDWRSHECVESKGNRDVYGYARTSIGGKNVKLHRLICAHHHGLRMAGTWVTRHLCGNNSCINPLHLVPGNAKANNKDRGKHGRTQRGESHTGAVLTDAQVMAIYRDPRPSGQVAADYGICQATASHIRCGRTWKHLTGGINRKLVYGS